jgi:GMP synthase (glutamine-hydrolysing)
LRRADAIVRRMCVKFDASVWQFPIILIPLGMEERPDSVVLRPVQSVDGMTANAVWMSPKQLEEIVAAIERVDGIAAVFYDVTNKPPATIEWE